MPSPMPRPRPRAKSPWDAPPEQPMEKAAMSRLAREWMKRRSRSTGVVQYPRIKPGSKITRGPWTGL